MISHHRPQKAQLQNHRTAHIVVTRAARKIIARTGAIIAWWIH
jgi:hypothetical protein